ncbi:hypothetical protein SEEHRA23_23180 [Salmonella enterica subsp. enterica serovar Heidelberg str. SARA33]|nr:hypothetical protein SEEHRA23_23180 [Salmonella enterica subsp. enterica serovar Heidelberg str. SARA33]
MKFFTFSKVFYDRLGTANLAKSMLWSREKAAREFGVTQRTWHAWENAEQVDVTVWRTTQALSVRDLLPHMQGMRKADIIRRLENELGETAEDV